MTMECETCKNTNLDPNSKMQEDMCVSANYLRNKEEELLVSLSQGAGGVEES